MDTFAATFVHYLLTTLSAIGADSIILFIANQYRNAYGVSQCLQSTGNYLNACGEFTMLGYIVIIAVVSLVFGRGIFFFFHSTS